MLKQTEFHGWPALVLVRGPLTATFTPLIGGRLMSLCFEGEELLFQHPELLGQRPHLPPGEPLAAAKERTGFPLWGGDKTWVAPQEDWLGHTPPVDLDHGEYTWVETENGLEMHSPVCRETGLRVARLFEWEGEGLVLEQTLLNAGDVVARRGIWNVTQCLRPMSVFLPLSLDALRPYGQEGDSVALFPQVCTELTGEAGRAAWVQAGLSPPTGPTPLVRVDCLSPSHFKVGGLAQAGDEGLSFVISVMKSASGPIGFIRTFAADPQAAYLHHASVEVYNAPALNYLEVEVHGPFLPLFPGESVSHGQHWKVFRMPTENPLGQ